MFSKGLKIRLFRSWTRNDGRSLTTCAAEALDYAPGQCWTRTPDPRIASLALNGRRIWDQVAVLDGQDQYDQNSIIVFLDLRPLAHFPQWLQLPDNVFDARAYFDGLQIEVDGQWTLMIEGGEPLPEPHLLRVRDRETLVFYLAQGEAVHDDPPGNRSSDESSDSSSGTFDPQRDSSDFFLVPAPSRRSTEEATPSKPCESEQVAKTTGRVAQIERCCPSTCL